MFTSKDDLYFGLPIYVDANTKRISLYADFDKKFRPLQEDLLESLSILLKKDIHPMMHELAEQEYRRLKSIILNNLLFRYQEKFGSNMISEQLSLSSRA